MAMQMKFLFGYTSFVSPSTLLQLTGSVLMVISTLMTRCSLVRWVDKETRKRLSSLSSYTKQNDDDVSERGAEEIKDNDHI